MESAGDRPFPNERLEIGWESFLRTTAPGSLSDGAHRISRSADDAPVNAHSHEQQLRDILTVFQEQAHLLPDFQIEYADRDKRMLIGLQISPFHSANLAVTARIPDAARVREQSRLTSIAVQARSRYNRGS